MAKGGEGGLAAIPAAGSLQAAPRASSSLGLFFRNSPFSPPLPLRSRHFIIPDQSVKQYDVAHFYLSRFTKPPFTLPARTTRLSTKEEKR